MTDEKYLAGKINLHTHTYRCNHAEGTVEDYCRAAVELGVTTLGFSEHMPFPGGEHGGSRMKMEELPLYRAEVEQAKSFSPDLLVLAGLELEYAPAVMSMEFYRELKEKLALDYCIGGTHFVTDDDGSPAVWKLLFSGDTPEKHILRYIKSNIHFLEIASDLLDYMVHPDFCMMGTNAWTPDIRAAFRDLAQASNTFGVPLEINAYGLRKGEKAHYPWLPFWEIAAEENVKCVIGADAHRPQDVCGRIDDCVALAEKLGLQIVTKEIIQKLKGVQSTHSSGGSRYACRL